MKRVIIIGSGGAGKSTLARRLGHATGIDVIHLDSLFWRPNWTPTPKEEWVEKVAELIDRDSWIIDGNFGGTRELRMAACDTIIWVDTPRSVCLYRALKRVLKYRNRSRPDMADGCNEKLDLDFLRWIWNYPKRIPALKAQFDEYKDKTLVVIRCQDDIEQLLRSVGQRN